MRRGDWVTTSYGGDGIIERIAKDGSWADVNWGRWKKRMPTSSLTVVTTIQRGNWVITDMTSQLTRATE